MWQISSDNWEKGIIQDYFFFFLTYFVERLKNNKVVRVNSWIYFFHIFIFCFVVCEYHPFGSWGYIPHEEIVYNSSFLLLLSLITHSAKTAEPRQTAVSFACLIMSLNNHESNQELCLTQMVILITCTIVFIFLF